MSEKIADVTLNFINTVYSTNSDGQIVKQVKQVCKNVEKCVFFQRPVVVRSLRSCALQKRLTPYTLQHHVLFIAGYTFYYNERGL